LNLNDCDVELASAAKAISEVVGDVDVLFTQFSYASWQGNVDDVQGRLDYAQAKLAEVKLQTDISGAKYVIPFASFVWFCHQENFYLNHDANRIDDVRDYLAANTAAEPVIMYPGERWIVGESHDSDEAVRKYLVDYAAVAETDLVSLPGSSSVAPDELVAACAAFQVKLLEHTSVYLAHSYIAGLQCHEEHRNKVYPRWQRAVRLVTATLFPSVPETTVFLSDYNQAYQFGLTVGLHAVDLDRGECDVLTTSDSLQYAFKNLFGGQSLAINGRFQECRPDGHFSFFRLFKLSFRLNEGFVPNLRANFG
jgi:UDP-MurNAc hydroxylase